MTEKDRDYWLDKTFDKDLAREQYSDLDRGEVKLHVPNSNKFKPLQVEAKILCQYGKVIEMFPKDVVQKRGKISFIESIRGKNDQIDYLDLCI